MQAILKRNSGIYIAFLFFVTIVALFGVVILTAIGYGSWFFPNRSYRIIVTSMSLVVWGFYFVHKLIKKNRNEKLFWKICETVAIFLLIIVFLWLPFNTGFPYLLDRWTNQTFYTKAQILEQGTSLYTKTGERYYWKLNGEFDFKHLRINKLLLASSQEGDTIFLSGRKNCLGYYIDSVRNISHH
jgi:hypothetical protein